MRRIRLEHTHYSGEPVDGNKGDRGPPMSREIREDLDDMVRRMGCLATGPAHVTYRYDRDAHNRDCVFSNGIVLWSSWGLDVYKAPGRGATEQGVYASRALRGGQILIRASAQPAPSLQYRDPGIAASFIDKSMKMAPSLYEKLARTSLYVRVCTHESVRTGL